MKSKKIRNLQPTPYKLPTNRGFTLIEVALVVGILLIVGGTAALLQRDFFRLNSYFQQSLLSQQEAVKAIRTMVKEIRASNIADNGAYQIKTASDNALTVYTDTNSDNIREEVRYYLENTNLKKGIIIPTGNPVIYDPANEVLTTMVRNIAPTTTPLFTYFDNMFTGTQTPMISPINASDVRLIEIRFAIDRDPNQLPEPLEFKTKVFLRNAKDN
ncbi:MAG: hypothetical protein COU08_04535 [Candidatus Harrisonbacteria bacterium CG10_big_fil_rev_8_21_14_0_10_42_17]|uniref:Prepilin-type N-terminal cleavage/methylation domain-containing protein n=1 Tax=Candidatus Harrisonbacteria bacterium CG10_big_fil_rev_8_21_14_0_10_42_17 TaxID=1974584 RepID=A0A2M6WH28_9BACT|nr:MAG: hypothetical protein COU08_04535 [Candidatus Harrisonbacteria bacterium CG10_big_fil_rev_8_21_14_0_10_42_17]